MAKKIIIAYIPVIHQGYRRLLESNPEYHTLYIVGLDIIERYRHLQKEIRALDPQLVKQLLPNWNLLDEVQVVDQAGLASLATKDVEILLPDDEVSHDLTNQYLTDKKVRFYPVFLRWDRRRSEASDPIDPSITMSSDAFAKTMLSAAQAESFKSTNIWRRVGAVLAKDGQVIGIASNQHRPSAFSPWLDGDVRANFGRGVGVEMSTDQHAESCVIANAAKQGVALEGADLYVTTFPCPPCAMLIAYSGIKRLFFAQGYAMLDGKRVLNKQGIEIIHVPVELPPDRPETYVLYPEK
jgi:dCMP deaminase